jgi:hypothetical protein
MRRFAETENEPECKQRLLLKQLQGSSCRSLGHDNDCDADDEPVDGSASSSQHRNNRLKPFWYRRISSRSAGGASARRRVIKRHCSWDEGTITNSSHRLQVLASPNNSRDEETYALDNSITSSMTPEPVLIGSSKNSVFLSIGGDIRAGIQHSHTSRESTRTDHGTTGIMAVSDRKPIPQQEPADGLGLDELSWSMEDYDDDHCSIDPDMPLAHVRRWVASSTPPMDYSYQKPESQQQQRPRPPVLQCSLGIKDGGGGCPIFPSPSPTDSNVTRSDDDDDDDDDLDDEDLRQLSFCPILLVDESSLAAYPPTPPPPSPMMDRWSPSPPLTIKTFGSEPPKLPTRGGGGGRQRHLAHEEEELSSCPLSPPKLPTRRPKMAEHEILLASANPATSAIPPLPPSPPLPLGAAVSPLGDVGGCPLAKPIARTAVPVPRGTCHKLLCDNGGIIVATESPKSAATAPSSIDPTTTVRNIAEDDDEVDDGDDEVVSPLIGGFMTEYAATSPRQLGYGYHHHGIQQKNSHNAVLGHQRRGILKDNDVVIRGHDKGIHEAAFRHGAQPRLQSEESSKKKKRNVTFGRIHIREYERVLGDNPSCSIGPPISLGWMHWDLHDSTLDAYETSQKSQRPASTRPRQRGKRDFYLSPSRRCELILHEWQSCPRVEQVRRLAPQCEDAALLVQYRRDKSTVESRSKSRLLPAVAALLCKPSVDDSDTSQPTNLHGRRQGGDPLLATTTMSKITPHEQGDNDDDDAESMIEQDSEV